MNENQSPRAPRATPIREARQRQLIEATIAAIGRYGYAKLTLNHVASLAGLSPGIVNFHFRSKEQLLAATLEYLVEEYEAYWAQAAERAGETAAAKLEAMIEFEFDPRVSSLEKVAVWYAFWAEAQVNPSHRETVSRLEARYFEVTRVLFQRLIEEGGYPGFSADAVAYGFNAMLDGFLNDLMIDPGSFDREEARRICRLFLSGLFPRHFAAPRPAAVAPGPDRPGALAALRALQAERAKALALFEAREAALLDELVAAPSRADDSKPS
jgi:TetR/AcrR family transcriptional repressor of bet genes